MLHFWFSFVANNNIIFFQLMMATSTDPSFSINSEQFSNYISFYKELVPDGDMLTGGCVCISFLFSVNCSHYH